MNRFLVVLFLIVICLAGVGLYRGWFTAETNSSDRKPNVNLSVDRDKIKEDINSLKNKNGSAAEKKDPLVPSVPPKN